MNTRRRIKNIVIVEFCRSVSDFNSSFALVRERTWTKTEYREQLREILGIAEQPLKYWNLLKVLKEPEFIECDSSNPSHACAYFNTEITGPDWLLHVIRGELDVRGTPIEPPAPLPLPG